MSSRLEQSWRAAAGVMREAAKDADDHAVPMMASSMAFWLLLTLAPFALLISVSQALLGKTGAIATVDTAVAAVAVAGDVAAIVANSSGWTALLTLLVVIFAASSFFSQFALALARIWGAPEGHGPMWHLARRHLLGFLLVGVLALALLVSVVAGSIIASAASEVAAVARGAGVRPLGLVRLLTGRFSLDLVASTALFLFAFTLVPARRILMRDVVFGAALTGFLYSIGQVALAWYLSTTSRITLAGSLGALIGLLLWVYYTSLIALVGAEITRADVLRREAQRTPVEPLDSSQVGS